MKRIHKTKAGFTLIEMVLVVAILVILASVLVLGVAGYVQRARNAASSLASHNSSIARGTSAIDAEMNGF